MKKHHTRIPKLTLALTLLIGAAGSAFAQTSDALIDKLVDKGILSVKEANQLREESDKDFTKAYSIKSGMPDWVQSLKINGDFRGRFEGFYDNNDGTLDRNRFRYRLRAGVTASMFDNMEVGFRLTSSDPATGITGGDPISGNTTMQDNGAKKNIYMDLAYAKYSPSIGPVNTIFTVGKMMNPFVFSDMVFDQDYTPEGAAQEINFKLGSKHTLRFITGEFILDESAASSLDPFLLGGQIRFESAWSTKIKTSVGLSGLTISEPQSLVTASVPNQNSGNTRVGAGGALLYHYNPVVADASFTYTLDSFPLYKGAFPITVGAEYMNNTAVKQQNQAYAATVTLGKAGKKGLWELSYRYKVLEGDAWYEELTDSDFGAIYRAAGASGSGNTDGTGYRAGTNVRGHVIKASYSPFDSTTLSVTYFMTELIQENPKASQSDVGRLQVDANWKF